MLNKEVTGHLVVVKLMNSLEKFKLDYQIKLFVEIWIKNKVTLEIYITPNEPAINPVKTKKENSARSLGRELTIRLSWVILPCAPQVINFHKI